MAAMGNISILRNLAHGLPFSDVLVELLISVTNGSGSRLVDCDKNGSTKNRVALGERH